MQDPSSSRLRWSSPSPGSGHPAPASTGSDFKYDEVASAGVDRVTVLALLLLLAAVAGCIGGDGEDAGTEREGEAGSSSEANASNQGSVDHEVPLGPPPPSQGASTSGEAAGSPSDRGPTAGASTSRTDRTGDPDGAAPNGGDKASAGGTGGPSARADEGGSQGPAADDSAGGEGGGEEGADDGPVSAPATEDPLIPQPSDPTETEGEDPLDTSLPTSSGGGEAPVPVVDVDATTPTAG